MELMQQVKGHYCDSREEEETREIITSTREAESSGRLQEEDGAASNFRKHQDLMELSLGRNREEGNVEEEGAGGGGGGGVLLIQNHSSSSMKEQAVEKEHMFDKVVTPSDVGKLNRLVIPKQHAEKYFPLDSSSNEKGLLLNFEDRNGKVWRFRYSYWNSSQSYVMTKGWSRFVKEKKLDAGDIVSFQRGLGDLYRHRLYIDWRRRPDHIHHAPHSHTPLFPWGITSGSVSVGGRYYSLPSTMSMSMPMPPPHRFHFHHHLNHNNIFTFQQQQQQQQYHHNLNSGSAASLYYLRSSSMSTPAPGPEMIIDSVPVAHHHHHHEHAGMAIGGTAPTNSGKRLRLFGVNMECASSAQDSKPSSSSSSSSSSLQRLRDHEDTLSLSGRFGDHRGAS